MLTNITLIGVLCLGLFVGLLFGIVLFQAKSPTVKIVLSVISAALSGAPVMFMRGISFERWMYPIGLLLGFLWVRVLLARQIKLSNLRDLTTILAWADAIGITVVTLVIVACAAFVPIT